MKAPLRQLERVASGTHYAPELLRLPLDTAKGCQGTIHNMRLQNMIQLSCGPPRAWASSHIALVRKTQRLLEVLANPFCQLGGQPVQNRVACPVDIFQPIWRGNSSLLGLRRLISRRTQPADCKVAACAPYNMSSIILYEQVRTSTY